MQVDQSKRHGCFRNSIYSGFNAGTEVTGVPQACITPSGNHAEVGSIETDWDQASNGDAAPDIGDWGGNKTQRFTVEEVGSEYRVLKQAEKDTYAPYHAGVLDTALMKLRQQGMVLVLEILLDTFQEKLLVLMQLEIWIQIR